MAFSFPIEASHVLAFARAIGEPDSPRTLAPPTFAIASDRFDPDYERRPRAGEPWFGSGARAVSVEGGSQQATGGGSGFHAEQRFVYHRPLRVGDRLSLTRREGEQWTREGRRGGRLRFREHVSELVDEGAGERVLTMTWVDVLTEKTLEGSEGAPPAPAARAPEAALVAEPVAFGGRRFAPGDVHETVLVEDLRRTQIVMYAGASGDFHPMHSDEPYARAMGFPGVFAHGMLTMGITGRALSACLGDAALADYRARFRAQVWPGDDLRARLTYEGQCERDGVRLARWAVEARNQRDEAVLTGEAHARVG